MKQLLLLIVFLLALMVTANVVQAESSAEEVMTIGISKPVENAFITQGATPAKKEAKVNFTYTPSTNNNVSWCRLIMNGTQYGVNPAVDRSKKQDFSEIGLLNGSWWYYIQCADNYTNIYNSSNQSFQIKLDDVVPKITPSNADSTYNTSDGRALFKFIATDYESGVENCTLIIENETKSNVGSVGNGSLTNFEKFYLPDGDYTWYVLCRDKVGNVGKSVHGQFIAELSTSQIITLKSPKSGSTDFDGYVTLKYTPVSRLPIKWCNLKLNETYNMTDNEIENNTENKFDTLNIVHGPYNWSVECTDSDSNSVVSHRWSLIIDKKVLISEYLSINPNFPGDNHVMKTGETDIEYTATAFFGLGRCELITNRSIRDSDSNVKNGTSSKFESVSFSPGIWNWRIRCYDKSENEYNTPLYTLTVQETKAEPIVETADPISDEVDEKDISERLRELRGLTKSLGLSSAAWITIVIVIIILGTAAVVIVIDRKFELELEHQVQEILYKLKLRKKKPGVRKKHALTEERKLALKEYIKVHMRDGVPRKQLEEHLKKNKWHEDHIKTVFKELEENWDEWRERCGA